MKISTKARYGMRAMVELAKAYPDAALSVKEVAARQRLSVKYLEQIMAPLKASGLVKAVRGSNGGYVLTHPPTSVLLSQIYTALEGAPAVVDCVEDEGLCGYAGTCPTRGVWCEVNNAIVKVLESITLADLVERGRAGSSNAGIAYCI